jgi:hypothetical protein
MLHPNVVITQHTPYSLAFASQHYLDTTIHISSSLGGCSVYGSRALLWVWTRRLGAALWAKRMPRASGA